MGAFRALFLLVTLLNMQIIARGGFDIRRHLATKVSYAPGNFIV